MAAAYYDARETRSAEEREAGQLQQLRQTLSHLLANSPAQAKRLEGYAPESLQSTASLQTLPVLRKTDLMELQPQQPPFGGLNTVPVAQLAHVYRSPGNISDAGGRKLDWWRFARSLYAAGIRSGDLVHNSFSYHFTPAGAMFDSAAQQLGCVVFPAGPEHTEAQAEALSFFRASAYAGVPDFLRILLEKADAKGLDTSCLKRAVVSGGPLFPAVKAGFQERGIAALQCYATADLGLISYESEGGEGMVVDEDVLVEIVRPGSGEVLPAGEVGEVLVTHLACAELPLIRFATGDLSAVLAGRSPCGRTGARLRGWLGRADQTTKVRGMFVHPVQVNKVLKSLNVAGRARLEITRSGERDVMTLKLEHPSTDAALVQALAQALQEETGLRGQAALVPPQSLPNDGKVIDDLREYGE